MPRLAASLLACLAVLIAPPARAEDEAPAHHGHHRNHVAVAVGATHVADATGPTLGADLETRLAPWLGIVVLVDAARLHATTHVLAATGVAVHPWRGWSVMAGVGWEHAAEHDAVAVRAATGYAVHLGPASIGPTVAVDRAAGETAVVGAVAVGAGF